MHDSEMKRKVCQRTLMDNNIMKTKENSRQITDKAMEKFKAGSRYKTIFQTLNV